MQYINQSWIYCKKWNSPAAPQQLRLGLLRHLHLRLQSSLVDLQSSASRLQCGGVVFSLQSPDWWTFAAVVSGAACGSHKFHALRRRCHKSMFSFVVLPFTATPPPLLRTATPPGPTSAVLWVTARSMLVLLLVVPIYWCPKPTRIFKTLKIAWQ